MINKLKAFFGIEKNILGIDFRDDSVRIVQSIRTAEKITLSNIAVVPLPKEQKEWKMCLERAFAVHGFSSSEVFLAISGRNFFFRNVKFPLMDSRALSDTVRWEAANYIPYEENTYYYDFMVSKKTEQHLQVTLAAGKKTYIDNLVKLFSDLSVNITVIDGAVFALARLLPAEQNYLIVFVEKTACQMILYQRAVPLISRTVLNEPEKTDASEPSILFDDRPNVTEKGQKLAQEIHDIIEYYKFQEQGAAVEKIYLSGGADDLSEYASQIKKYREEPVLFLDPLAEISSASFLDRKYVESIAQKAAVAIGLVLRKESHDEYKFGAFKM